MRCTTLSGIRYMVRVRPSPSPIYQRWPICNEPLPQSVCRACRGPFGIGLAIVPGFRAFFHQPRGGLLGAVSPIQCDQAPRKIGPADVLPVAVMGKWRTFHTTLIARPSVLWTPRPAENFLGRILGSHQPQGIKLWGTHPPPRPCFQN